MSTKKGMKRVLAFMLAMLLLFTAAGCGNSKDESDVEALQEMNQIPEDGIITKEQFKTVVGESKTLQFTGEASDGTTYTWTFNANLIKNPQDQNLKITFENDVLAEVQAIDAEAVNALKLNMGGQGLIAAGKLSITIPELWEANSASFVKVEDGAFTELSDVTVTKDEAAQTTTLEMDIISMDEVCYIVGKATPADGAEAGNTTVDDTTTSEDAATSEEGSTDDVSKSEEGSTTKDSASNTSKNSTTTTAKKSETTTAKKSETTTAKKSETTTVKKEETTTAAKTMKCTISISCATILDNMDQLNSAKKNYVPSDGWILKKTTVTFTEGESVHDVLKRVCKSKGIHMESSYTPIYDSAYVEGINQLYEFDCGSQSGWMYKVNGWFPNYGCSQYKLSDGDVIAWVYTCDLGADVGDNSMQ